MKKCEKIVTWIQEEVRSGRKVSGEKLPSEQELSEQFQVSRQTVRRALEELVKENIVESRRGSGSYIRLSGTNCPGFNVPSWKYRKKSRS